MKRLFFSCVLGLPWLAGCANHPAPNEQLRLTDQALAQARAVGASEVSAELMLAERKRDEAAEALAEGDHKRARMLAEQAELDARLAEARALQDKIEAQAAHLSRRIERLRGELRGGQ